MVILKKWLPMLHAEIPKMNYNSESSLMKLMLDLMDPETINIGGTHYEFARSIVCHSEENRYRVENEDFHIDTPLRLEIVNRFPDLAGECENELINDIEHERLLLIAGPNIDKKEKKER
jgi:hypothetical protein